MTLWRFLCALASLAGLWPRAVVGLRSLRVRALPVNATHLPGATDPLCRVLAPDGGTAIDIWEIAGNRRAVSFSDSMSYESQAQCTGDMPTCEPLPLEQREVHDVADCPQCDCESNSTDVVTLSQSCEALAERIATRCAQASPGRPVDVLMLGLGGGTLHAHVRKECPPQTRVRSVEIDPRLAAVASRYFGLPLEAGVSEVVVDDALDVVRKEAAAAKARAAGVAGDAQGAAKEEVPARAEAEAAGFEAAGQEAVRAQEAKSHAPSALPAWAGEDARSLEEELKPDAKATDPQTLNSRDQLLSDIRGGRFLQQGSREEPLLGSRGWDVIVVDCFIGLGRTPESCRSAEFISDARASLAPGGVVLHHLWHKSPKASEVSEQYEQAMGDYKSIYGQDMVQVVPVPRDARIMFDDVIVASR